jgi:hypothetical protein
MRENQLAMSYRDEVDAIFYTLLRERGVSCLVAKVAYYAVRLGGNYAIRRGGPKEQEVV